MKNLTLLVIGLLLSTFLLGQNLSVEGKVGIGIDPPVHDLDILSTDFEPIRLSSDAAGGTSILFENDGTEANIGLGNSDDIIFRMGNTTYARITNNGDFVLDNGSRLGINIDNPTQNFQIDNTGINSTDFSMWITSGNGVMRTNRWAHLQMLNLNSSKLTNYWHIGPRTDDSFDIAYGEPNNDNTIEQTDALFRMLPDGNGIFPGKVTIGSDNEAEFFAGLRLDDNLDITMHGDNTKAIYFYGSDNALDGILQYINNGNMVLETNVGSLFLDGETALIFNTSDVERMEIDEVGRTGVNIDPLSNVQFYTECTDYSYSLYGNNGRENASAYGVFGRADGDGTGSRFGVYGIATGSGGGTKYGVYGVTSGSGTEYAGYFNGNVFSTGSYLPSDKNLKANIRRAESSLDRILQLEVKTYEYDAKLDGIMNLQKGEQTGLLAQEVESIFPELIKETQQPITTPDENANGIEEKFIDFKAINYVGLIPHLVKVAQEQQTKIETLETEKADFQTQIDGLQKELAELKQMVAQLAAAEKPATGAIQSSTATLSSAKLEQNQPNPFSEATTISYFVPNNVRQAEIRISTIDGKLIKTVPVQAGSGQLTLDAYSLQQGSYTYTLFLDGKLQETRQMVLTR